MNNPIKIYNDILQAYLKYINSGLAFFNDKYNEERNELLKETGTISQPPIIELVPKYHEKNTLREFCEKEHIAKELDDFVASGLFYNPKGDIRKLYDHQYQALKDAFIARKNIIVTTGTGSGKTECFLLPVIADLVSESKSWGKNRKRAIRTMILYPLNALAEDQMIRLRKTLNSRRKDGSGSLDWLDRNRTGNRFYFGRYTGRSPVSGTKEKSISKLREAKKDLITSWEAAKKSSEGNDELLYHIPCMEKDSAEMWDRFSMQENAPDILITNYSMLNIMLMRDIESDMFENTKKWLEEDKNNVFHLVIDELHTYRGTSGTEVAYLIRVLLDRLGLRPDSPQVQFLASSASMQKNDQTQDYLCEFFGVDKKYFKDKFSIISNPEEPKATKPAIELPTDILTSYSLTGDKEALFKATGCNDFYDIFIKYDLLGWLKYSLDSDHGVIAKDIIKIADTICTDKKNKLDIVSAIIQIICQSKKNNIYVAPIRAHFFFRNVNGLWACSDPHCSVCRQQYKFSERLAGKFYKRPRTTCDCGMNVLEVLICENCGELFMGGYLVEQENHMFLKSEMPITDSFVRYCVLWQGETTLKDEWEKVDYNPKSGEITYNIDGKYCIHRQPDSETTVLPHKCPKCQVSYKSKDKNSLTPIRRHGTGLQKINQILADALIRSMKHQHEENTKVVLFSDSRQSAAKLSAGIELDHYRDILRWAIISSIEGRESEIDIFKKLSKNSKTLSEEERKTIQKLSNDKSYSEYFKLISLNELGLLSPEQKNRLETFLNSGSGQRLDKIENTVISNLIKVGTNPAGPKPSVSHDDNVGDWDKLFDFKKNTFKDDLGDCAADFATKIRGANRLEQLTSIFSNKKRSFEELRLGYLCPTARPKDEGFFELICSIIRIMGENKRIKNFLSQYPYTDSFPRGVRNLIKEIYGHPSKAKVDEIIDEVRHFLRINNIIEKDKAVLTGEGLTFMQSKVGSQYWVCPICKTIHMQHSNGICINCNSPLGSVQVLTKEEIDNPEDYYLALLNSGEDAYKLHCEELSGQTSREDSQKRQRLFQNIFLEDENRKVEGIDLLSVTTTMEAGVDIGSLSAVMMGNVPPQRFNYQQRVGRAGRRNHPLSIALTVAKGTSHDLTHFFEYERMVSETPKDPYLEVRTTEIAERIINKELLYLAMKEKQISGKENVHGNFGSCEDWEKIKPEIDRWIKENQSVIKHIISTVTTGTCINDVQKKNILDSINDDLTKRISEIASSNDYTQDFLSERLANAGLLPMFGFPTRTRNLYLKKPEKLPSDNIVSRDIDMALSSFAPGHEIVKDKKIYKAVGVVEYEYNKAHQIVPKYNCLNKFIKPLRRCDSCGYSTIEEAKQDSENLCPVCGNLMTETKICSPLGFCVDYNKKPEDFNGSYDWYSPNSDIKLDCEKYLSDCPQVKNIKIRNNKLPSQGLVHLINDNNGDFYRLGKTTEGLYISRDAYTKEEGERLELQYESKYAFISSKTTGVLTLEIDDIPDYLNLSPLREYNRNSNAVYSAFLSWGYLVRKSISTYLDIDSSELNVGFYINPITKNAQIFLVEKLENGAGYCNYLSGRNNKDIPQKAIINPLVENGELYELLVKSKHCVECTDSCYDCIRDFSNQSIHSLLNWRLGLDIARLSNDINAKIDFDVEYWKPYIQNTISNILKQNGYCILWINGILTAENPEGDKICIIHPLWSDEYVQEIIGKIGEDIRPISITSIITSLE